jgi:hypothetical protein
MSRSRLDCESVGILMPSSSWCARLMLTCHLFRSLRAMEYVLCKANIGKSISSLSSNFRAPP